MGHVVLTMNGRSYRLSCNDGEEERLKLLGAEVSRRVMGFVQQFGRLGDEQALLMASLMLADELLEAKAKSASKVA